MGEKPVRHGHDLGDARLVVSAKQRGAIGVDQGVSHTASEIGLTGRRYLGAGCAKDDVAARVRSDDLRADWRSRGSGVGIEVGEKSQHGNPTSRGVTWR